MKEYEVIWEIFNKCPRNQMRDVFVEEVETADPEEYVKHKFQGKDVSIALQMTKSALLGLEWLLASFKIKSILSIT